MGSQSLFVLQPINHKMLVQFLVLPLFISQTYSAPQISFACIFGCSHRVDSPTNARIAIDPIPNNFHDDCEGQLNMVPSKQYKNLRVKYEKMSSESKNKWTIKRNRRKDRVKISYISIKGNCCWKTCDRNGTVIVLNLVKKSIQISNLSLQSVP